MIHKFFCDFCERTKEHDSETTTGYGTMPGGKKVCFACCAILDKQEMDKIVADKRAGKSRKICLYLTTSEAGSYLTNWPGTLKMACHGVSRSRVKNMARTDVWFVDHRRRLWHGRNQGDTQIVHCRPVKT